MTTAQVALGLTGTQLAAMTNSQLSAMTTAQVCAILTADTQLDNLTIEQLDLLGTETPIVLDLNGDGVRTLSIAAGVQFDIAADGSAAHTGWVSSTDGLLVMDRNADGSINDGSELFGSATTLADGSKAANGYVALSELDTNQDGMVSSLDAGFAKLQVWVDANSDGVSTGGELKSLTDMGISNISVVAERNISSNNGNIVGLTSSYQTTDGANHAAADVWFITDEAKTGLPVADVTAKPVGLSARVSDLVNAMGQFDTAAPANSLQGSLGQGITGQTAAGAAVAVGSMVDMLRQFDANGNAVLGAASLGVAPVTKLNVPGLGDAVKNGMLASTPLK
jgi:hypothetical protein